MNSTHKTRSELIKIEHSPATISCKTLEIVAERLSGKNFHQKPVTPLNSDQPGPSTPEISLSSLS